VAVFGVFYQTLTVEEANNQHSAEVVNQIRQWFYGSGDRNGGRNKRQKLSDATPADDDRQDNASI
jgi:hypothetical protein